MQDGFQEMEKEKKKKLIGREEKIERKVMIGKEEQKEYEKAGLCENKEREIEKDSLRV